MGLAIAKKYVEEGANVVISGRNKERLINAETEIKDIGDNIVIYQMDVRNPEEANAMVNFAAERFGRVDGLINNAAGNFWVKAVELSPNGW